MKILPPSDKWKKYLHRDELLKEQLCAVRKPIDGSVKAARNNKVFFMQIRCVLPTG
jgi:hypothetical protein